MTMPTMDGATFFAEQRLRWREKEFQREVLTLAKDHGWTHRYHTYFSDRSEAGFPDVVLVNPARNRIIFAELKTMRGKTTPTQDSWLNALMDGGGEVYIWRPCCWNSGELQAVLA